MSEEKIKELIETIKKEPKNLDNYRALADLFIDRKDFQSAFNVYQEILKTDENDIQALLNSGSIMFYAKKFKESTAFYLKGLEIEPENGLLHYNLGNVYAEINNFEDALKEYKKAVSF
ncbi:MAG: tetratricopeptide repeat protein, partial [bacterium]|nr:tetratricopeptide repeat protein [bacterium]